MNLRVLGSLAALVSLLLAGQGAAKAAPDSSLPPAGQITTNSLTDSAGTRSYQTFVPLGWKPGRPLVIWLHGASNIPHGDHRGLAVSSTLVDEAGRQGFAVVAPMQSLTADRTGAWRIFDPANIIRGKGESSIIADITRRSIRDLRADPARVYVIGHSAGGAMAQNVSALYSGLFAGMATIAGVPFAGDPTGIALRVARRGALMPTYIVQGDRDTVTPPLLGQVTLRAALSANGVPAAQPSSTELFPIGGDDPYAVKLQSYGAGASSVNFAIVQGADHPTGAGGVTVGGRSLDHSVIDFLLAQHKI